LSQEEEFNKRTEAVFFDFGGVIADEGFREGLFAIAANCKLDPAHFFEVASDVIYDTGYITGKASESSYWELLRLRTGVPASDFEMRLEILRRFRLRPWMLRIVDKLRHHGYFVALLSDQTNWLDELDAAGHFSGRFDAVFNSYHLGKGKKDASVFTDVASLLGIEAESCLFVDDNPGNISRASSVGYQTILYRTPESFLKEILLLQLIPGLDLVN
jgi:HAD superfamily hydrolase (TIGR01509 family)